MVESEGAHYRKTKNRHHGNQKRKVSHIQKTPLLRRGGSPVEFHLKDRTYNKQNASLLRRRFGTGGAPAEGQLQKVRAKNKAMNPPAPSFSSPSEDFDAPFDFCLDAPKTKVVVRCLPPSISEKTFTDSIPLHLVGLFNLISFIAGKPSKRSTSSRAYIDFKNPEDVFKFFEEFNGHLFVNEKGTEYKALVEYAPHQRVPNPFPKEDTEEGAISEDPEYLEFLDGVAKPIKLLPSAEVQLEKKEAENGSLAAGANKTVVVTPLMEYVRHKRVETAQNVFMANRRNKNVLQESSSLVNSIVSSKRTVYVSSANAKCAATTVNPSVKLTYVPCHLREANQYKEVSLDAKGNFFEVPEKVIAPEKDLAETVQIDQKVGASKQSVGSCRQIRKDTRLEHTDLSKKFKGGNGFRRYEKQVWVAKSASGSKGK